MFFAHFELKDTIQKKCVGLTTTFLPTTVKNVRKMGLVMWIPEFMNRFLVPIVIVK